MRVAFVGLGVMGYPMAGYLAKSGHETVVYNRTGEKAERWAREYGGATGPTPRQAAEGAENRLPDRVVAFADEPFEEPEQLDRCEVAGDRARPRVVDEVVPLERAHPGERAGVEPGAESGVVGDAEEPVAAGVHDERGPGLREGQGQRGGVLEQHRRRRRASGATGRWNSPSPFALP